MMMSSSKKGMEQRRNKRSDRCLRNSSCNCVMFLVMSKETKNSKNEIYKQLAETFQCTSQEIGRKTTQLTKPF